MEQYSRQFIEELAKHIDPAIADFFNMKHEIFKFPAKTFTELIDETLMDYLEGKTSREDLIQDFGVSLCHFRIGMTEHFSYIFQWNIIR